MFWEWHDVGSTVGDSFVATFYDSPMFVFNSANIQVARA
jgi:hypothetical protein